MKNIFLTVLISFGIILPGCNIFNKHDGGKTRFNSGSIKTLVIKATGGDKNSNTLLSNLVDLRLPVLKNYNRLTVDSLITKKGNKVYFVLVTYPNPVYNRFAIYNTNLRAYLIDKSLNGYVDYKIDSTMNKKLIELDENFTSKDVLNLKRLSLYQIFDTTANLVFRNFTELKSPDNDFFQNISELTDYQIKSVIGSSTDSDIFNKSDVFNWDTHKKEYVSFDSLFDKFILNYVSNFNYKTVKPEITDYNSAMASTGADIGKDSSSVILNPDSVNGFGLNFSEDWDTLKNFSVVEIHNKSFKGVRFINQNLGASISIIMLPFADSAENFTSHKLINSVNGKYLFRYSEKIAMKKDFVQYFEYSNGSKKYLLILRASKYTFNKHKTLYQKIINSFTIAG